MSSRKCFYGTKKMEIFKEILSISLLPLLVALVAMLTYYKGYETTRKGDDEEIKTIKLEFKDLIEKDNDTDVIKLMSHNLLELKEYYTINKQQARKSFWAALIMSVLGFLVFVVGIAAMIFYDKDVYVYSMISGSLVEVIAGLFFYLYNRSMQQINIFFGSLLDTQRYLSSIQLVDKIESNKDVVYAYIISLFMGKNDIDINDIVKKMN